MLAADRERRMNAAPPTYRVPLAWLAAARQRRPPRFMARPSGNIERRGRRCEDPEHDPRYPIGRVIYPDHIVELKDGGAVFGAEYLVTLCTLSSAKD
jgi:hypothetical protein